MGLLSTRRVHGKAETGRSHFASGMWVCALKDVFHMLRTTFGGEQRWHVNAHGPTQLQSRSTTSTFRAYGSSTLGCLGVLMAAANGYGDCCQCYCDCLRVSLSCASVSPTPECL